MVVIRATVPVGTSDRLKCYFMPEFLTEKNYLDDFINNKEWVFGLKGNNKDNLFKFQVNMLINYAYNNYKINYNSTNYLSNSEAEMVKLFRNTFLATKVSFCNEMYEFCQKSGVNYENVRQLAVADPRIGASHTNVPGHDGRFGYGGTCFPKDTNSLKHQMKQVNMTSYIIDAAVNRNEMVDRNEKDWNDNKGRAVVE